MDLVPETLPYRVYLRGELGKLRGTGDATDFLAAVDESLLDRCELPKDVTGLSSRFHDQSLVDAFVAELTPDLAAELADRCTGIGAGTRWPTSSHAGEDGGLSPCR